MGYHRVGFEVVGVDHKPQPRYPFTFIQGDALEYCREYGHEYDAIHASPPCQAYIAGLGVLNAKRGHRKDHPRLIEPTRHALRACGVPYVIENVPGAPLCDPVQLCGSSFGLGVRRHRLFESNLLLLVPRCSHKHQGRTVGVYGNKGSGELQEHPLGGWFYRAKTDEEAGEAMGIDWMVWQELTQAIPPAYTEWIGRQLMQALMTAQEAS